MLVHGREKDDLVVNFPPRACLAICAGRPSEMAEDGAGALHMSTSPGADLAREIFRHRPCNADNVPQPDMTLVIQLGLKGCAGFCDFLLITLLSQFPNAFSDTASIYT